MTHALNLTLPLKQDAETQAKLKHLVDTFAEHIQPEIEEALKKSKIVHFARVLVIDNKYIQVITEYEGDHQEYTEFFRRELPSVFAAIFGLAAVTPSSLDSATFWEFSKNHNIRSLGTAKNGALDAGGNPAGWLFSAYDDKDVRTIQAALGQ